MYNYRFTIDIRGNQDLVTQTHRGSVKANNYQEALKVAINAICKGDDYTENKIVALVIYKNNE